MRRIAILILALSLQALGCANQDDGLGVVVSTDAGAPLIMTTQAVIQQKTSPDDRNAGDQFGASVYVTGNRVIVGAPNDDNTDCQGHQ
jgi:hypothetical protein